MTENNTALSRQILRQIASDTNQRFLRNLPMFHAANDGSSPWEDLLRRLDRVESQCANAGIALTARRS